MKMLNADSLRAGILLCFTAVTFLMDFADCCLNRLIHLILELFVVFTRLIILQHIYPSEIVTEFLR